MHRAATDDPGRFTLVNPTGRQALAAPDKDLEVLRADAPPQPPGELMRMTMAGNLPHQMRSTGAAGPRSWACTPSRRRDRTFVPARLERPSRPAARPCMSGGYARASQSVPLTVSDDHRGGGGCPGGLCTPLAHRHGKMVTMPGHGRSTHDIEVDGSQVVKRFRSSERGEARRE